MKQIITFAMLVILLSSFTTGTTAEDLHETTVEYYKFEDTSGELGSNNTLTVVNTPTLVSAKIDDGYDFELADADVLYTGGNGDFALQDFTINCWIKPETLTNWQRVITNTYFDGSNAYGWYLEYTTNGALAAQLWSGSGFGLLGVQSSDSALSTGSFQMVTMTFDGSQIDLFTNSSEVSYSSHPSSSFTIGYNANNRFAIGDSWWASSWLSSELDSVVDECSIFNKVLSQTEINYLYNSGTPGSDQQYPYSLVGPTLNITELLLTSPSPDQNLTASGAKGNTTDTTPSFKITTNIASINVDINGSTPCTNTTGALTEWSCIHPTLSIGNHSIFINATDGTTNANITRTVEILQFDNVSITGVECNWTITTPFYQVNTTDGVITDFVYKNISTDNFGNRIGALYSSGFLLDVNTNNNCTITTDTLNQVIINVENPSKTAEVNWTFNPTYIKRNSIIRSSTWRDYSYLVAGTGSAYNSTEQLVNSSLFTNAKDSDASAAMNYSVIVGIYAQIWNSSITTGFGYSNGNEALAVGRGEEISANVSLLSYIKILEKNNSQSGDSRITQPLKIFREEFFPEIVPSDTCQCSSIQAGTTIDCSESCTITTCDANTVDVVLEGVGTIKLNGDLIVDSLSTDRDCIFSNQLGDGNQLIIKNG